MSRSEYMKQYRAGKRKKLEGFTYLKVPTKYAEKLIELLSLLQSVFPAEDSSSIGTKKEEPTSANKPSGLFSL